MGSGKEPVLAETVVRKKGPVRTAGVGPAPSVVGVVWQPSGQASETVGPQFPSTRYQGSKRRLLPSLSTHFERLEFDTALDAFGGAGCVAWLLKSLGKRTTYNDSLGFNALIGRALVENDAARLSAADVAAIGQRGPDRRYDDFIARTFRGVYFTDEENAWLDTAAQNVAAMRDPRLRAMAYFAVFQACLAKRPYNLFHRRNLYMRTARVARSFGNKTTWERGFDELVARFANEANRALIDGDGSCRAVCGDALAVLGEYDLVYVDPPYTSARGVSVDYLAFYHFLEGLVDFRGWPARIDATRKHLPLVGPRSTWSDPRATASSFERLFARFARSTLVVSYRNDGRPSIDELAALLRRHKRRVAVHELAGRQYALSKNRKSREMLIIGS